MTTARWALAVALGLAGLAPAAPAQLTRQGWYTTDAAVPAAAVHCSASGRPVATLVAHGGAGQSAAFATWVNGTRNRAGTVRADAHGLFVVTTPVPDRRTSTLQLTLDRRVAVTAVLPASCAAPAVGGASVPARGNPASYALNHNADGSVTRWDPCAGSIHVRVNPGPAGRGVVSDARAALAALGRATGLHLVYDGTTAFVPTRTNSARQPADLVVAWAPPGRTDWYTAGAVGEGGWRSSGVSHDGGRTWAWRITQGFVVVDPGVRLAPGFGPGLSRGALLLHELGHAAGLAHTGDLSQVMYPVLSSRSHGTWGAGDATGLRLVGARAGCVRAR